MANEIQTLVEDYIFIREELSNRRKIFEAFENESKQGLVAIEANIMKKCNDLGVDSFKTPKGTAFLRTKDYARLDIGGREKLDKYVLESGNTQVFTNHLSKNAIKELINENLNPAEIGVIYYQEEVVQVRSPSKSTK